MKKKFRFICLIFALILVFVFSSCSSASSIPERYVEAVMGYKNSLKDPTSMRIYGDVLVQSMVDPETEEVTGTFISIFCDAKNSYGGYGGKSEILIVMAPSEDPAYIDEDSSSYLDIRGFYEVYEEVKQYIETGNTANGQIDLNEANEILNSVTFEILSGEQMANAVGAEYFEV